MPHVEVYVDPADVIDDLSDDDLAREIARRRKKRPGKGLKNATHRWTPLGLAEDLRTAFYARDASRFEHLLCALDDGRAFEAETDNAELLPA
jgi:hypothetical protein